MNRSGHFFALALCAAAFSACGDGAGGGTKPVDAARSDATLMDAAPEDAATEDAAPSEDARADADALGCDAQVCDDAGQCACEPCPPGTLDCPCAESDAGVADLCGEDLLCGDDSKCIACEFGTDGCRCRPETDADAGLSRCDPGFACNEDGLCAACSNGEVGCPCIEGACGDGLLCGVGDVCRSPQTCGEVGCVRGQVCQAESRGQDAVCTPECEAGYAPWNAAAPGCIALPSCAEGDPGSIAQRCAAESRVCVDASLADDVPAACGGCLAGEEDFSGACQDLRPPPVRCAAAARVLVGDTCGACLDTHVEDLATDTCVDRLTCAELARGASPCGANQACVEATLARDAYCEARTCEATEYLRNGDCSACSQCYNNDRSPKRGVTGHREAPDAQNRCVCRLEPGFFQRANDGVVQACDDDGDGWVTDLLLPVEAAADRAFLENQTCAVRSIDRFELISDDAPTAARLPAYSVSVEQVASRYRLGNAAYERAPDQSVFVRLIEPDALDRAGELTERYDDGILKPYGATGAGPGYAFTPVEVNPLTKACNHDEDDLNADGYPDSSQSQDAAWSQAGVYPPSTPVFFHMAYFIEANRALYRAPRAGERYGAYVIIEKRRGATDVDPLELELTYGENDPAGWAVCARSRDSEYDPNLAPQATPQVGMDFAQYRSCEAAVNPRERPGHCLVDGRPDEANGSRHQYGRHIAFDGRARRTSVSDALTGPDLADSQWPGMNHHSQFKCGKLGQPVRADAPLPPAATGVVYPAQVGSQYTLQRCVLNAPAGAMGMEVPRSDADAQAPLGALLRNPGDPRLTCVVVDDPREVDAIAAARASAEDEGQRAVWLAWRSPEIQPTLGAGVAESADRYVRGCINEAAEWPFLCPGYTNDLFTSAATPIAAVNPLGQLICGCGSDRSGLNCELGCAGDHLMRGGEFAGQVGCDESGFCAGALPEGDFGGGQRGLWLCGTSSASVGPVAPREAGPVAAPEGCALQPLVAVLGDAGGRVDTNTNGGLNLYDASCGGVGPEAVVALVLTTPAAVRATIVDADYDPLLFVRSAACDDPGLELACNDDSEGVLSAVDLGERQPGTYYFFVDGYNGQFGTATLDISVVPSTEPAERLGALSAEAEAEVLADPANGGGVLVPAGATLEWVGQVPHGGVERVLMEAEGAAGGLPTLTGRVITLQ